MTPIYAATILLVAFAVGEYVNVKSEARLSAILTTSMILIVMFWLGCPAEIMTITGFGTAAGTMYSMTMVNMGTMVKVDDMLTQWRTLITGVAAVCAIVALVVAVGPMIVPRQYALAGAPVAAGGMPVYIMVSEAAGNAGFKEAGLFGLLVLLTQSLVGIPISSLILRKMAQRLISGGELAAMAAHKEKERRLALPRLFKPMPEALHIPVILLAKAALLASLAQVLYTLTGQRVHYMIFALLLGIVGCQIGFVEKDFFREANGFGLIMFFVLVYCFGSLPDLAPSMLLGMILPWIVVFALSIVAIAVSTFVMSKIVKMPYPMTFVIGLTALYGFPGTYVVSNEVANAVGRNEEERQQLLDYFLPKMLVAGFSTITISSLLVVGFVLPMF